MIEYVIHLTLRIKPGRIIRKYKPPRIWGKGLKSLLNHKLTPITRVKIYPAFRTLCFYFFQLSLNASYKSQIFGAVKMIKHPKCSSLGYKKKNIKHFLKQSSWVRTELWFLWIVRLCLLHWGQEEMKRKEINWKMTLMLESLFSSTRHLLLVFISNSQVIKNILKSCNRVWEKSPEQRGTSCSFIILPLWRPLLLFFH